jgi:hypothetical protein
MRRHELTRALQHLEASRRLLREALALRPLAAVVLAIRATERELAAGRPAQPLLALEPGDEPPAVDLA